MAFIATINPQGGFGNAEVRDGAGIEATKLIHHATHAVELAEQNTAVVAGERLAYVVQSNTEELVTAEAAIVVQATGADRTVTVDLLRSTGGGAFASIMSATIDIDDGTTILVPVVGVLSTTQLVAGDVLKWVVTVAGAAGAQAKGLIAALTVRPKPIS